MIGNEHMGAAVVPSEKSRLATLLICFFIGVFGIHRMYIGKVGTGVVMLLLTLTGLGLWITAIWAFCDFIMIAAGQQKDGKGRIISKWDTAQHEIPN